MGGLGKCCCTDCGSACDDVDIPVSVTLTPPYAEYGGSAVEGTFDLTNLGGGLSDIGDIEICDRYRADLGCTADADWRVVSDVSTETDWPASNPNDAAYAVGQSAGCTQCNGYYPSESTGYYEESKYYSRTTRYLRQAFTSQLRIDPLGTAGFLRISYSMTAIACGGLSYCYAAKNRVKIVTIACNNDGTGVVTANEGWFEADTPTIPMPPLCITRQGVPCVGAGDPSDLYLGACTETSETIGTSTSGCYSIPFALRSAVGQPWCNAVPFDPVNFCSYNNITGITQELNGAATSNCGVVFSSIWSLIIDCHDLYDDPLVLSRTGGGGTYVYGDVTITVPGTINIKVNS
jgi:hypothetical protein